MTFGEMIGILIVSLVCVLVAVVFYIEFEECNTTPKAIVLGSTAGFFGAIAIVLMWLTLAIPVHA